MNCLKDNTNAATAKNRLKPIKKLLKTNDVEISWHLVDQSLPYSGKSKDRAYTRDELQKMMAKAVDITDKIIITCASSGGFRVEAWDYFTWDDLVIFYSDDGEIKGGALRVYRGDIEEYWTHITPEACSYIVIYKEEWKSRFFNYPKKNDPLLVQVRGSFAKRLRAGGVKTRAKKFVTAIGIRPPLKDGERRHEVMLNHGFRKYQNTMFRRSKVNFADKEDMQGQNPGGQESSYGRYVEDDFERFPEYQKAIPLLTISDEWRAKAELQLLKNDKTENAKLKEAIIKEHHSRKKFEKETKQTLAKLRSEKLENYKNEFKQ